MTLDELEKSRSMNDLWLLYLINKALECPNNWGSSKPYGMPYIRKSYYIDNFINMETYRRDKSIAIDEVNRKYESDLKRNFRLFSSVANLGGGKLHVEVASKKGMYQYGIKKWGIENFLIPIENIEPLVKLIMAILSYTFHHEKNSKSSKMETILDQENWDDSIPISYEFFSLVLCRVQDNPNLTGWFDEMSETVVIHENKILSRAEITYQMNLELSAALAANNASTNWRPDNEIKRSFEAEKDRRILQEEKKQNSLEKRKRLLKSIGCPYAPTFHEYKRFLKNNVGYMDCNGYFGFSINKIFDVYIAYPS